MIVDGDVARLRVPVAMSLAALLRHPCGVCGHGAAYGAGSCRHCGARGVLMKYGPRHIHGRAWLFAIGVIVVPFLAAVWAAHQR